MAQKSKMWTKKSKIVYRSRVESEVVGFFAFTCTDVDDGLCKVRFG